jgi:hypothetical protein
MPLEEFINSVRREVAKRFDLKTDAEIDAFFIGAEESAKNNQEALEKRDKMLRDTVAELCEAKRLLKAAFEDINAAEACDTCEYYPVINSDMCQKDDCYKWRYADEALALIGKDIDVPASEGDTNVGHKRRIENA